MTSRVLAEQAIAQLCAQYPNLWWPKYLFHHTDLSNLLNILQDGKLLSRREVIRRNKLKNDCAADGILRHTKGEYMDCVRLYFRPKTPTLFHIEGICPNENKDSKFGRHCPIPVFLIFRSVDVLSISGVKFSDGNLAHRESQLFESLNDFALLDFNDIYHSSAIMDSDTKERVIRRRCAEVVVPDSIDFNLVEPWIIARSPAEREMILNLLPKALLDRYEKKVTTSPSCFHRKNHFVESVNLQSKEVSFEFANPGGKFHYQYEFEFSGKFIFRDYEKPQTRLYWKSPVDRYRVQLRIDRVLAFKGNYSSESLVS